jgi:hypothetical protein
MKFKSYLTEAGSSYVIDREDLLFIHNALDKFEKGEVNACFINALVEAIKIVSDGRVKLSAPALKKDLGIGYDGIPPHYSVIHDFLKNKGARSKHEPKLHKLELDITDITETSEVKGELKRGHVVLLSITINDVYWDFFSIISGWRSEHTTKMEMEKYGETLSKEFMDKVHAGIIPYPPINMLKRGRTSVNKHAILVVGYDPTEKVFICKDVLISVGKFSGLFKLDEKFFFNPELGKMVVILHAMGIGIEKESTVKLSKIELPEPDVR